MQLSGRKKKAVHQRLRAEYVVLRGQFCILASCCLSPMRKNSVLEELSCVDNGRRYLAPRYAVASADQPPLPQLYSATGMAFCRR